MNQASELLRYFYDHFDQTQIERQLEYQLKKRIAFEVAGRIHNSLHKPLWALIADQLWEADEINDGNIT